MQKLDLTIRRGETVAIPIRIESASLTYKTITAITKAGPMRLTVTAHGCPEGWRAAVANAGGMSEINYPRSDEGKPPKDKDLRTVSVIDANTIEFNAINSAAFTTYTSGGQLVFYAPLDLSAYDGARMDVKAKIGTAVLLSLSTTDGTLEIDAAANVLWVRLTDEASAAIAFAKGVFDIELTTAAGDVKSVCSADSTLTVLPEVTTS